MNIRRLALIALLLITSLLHSCREDDITDTVKWCNEVDSNPSKFKTLSFDLNTLTNKEGSILGYMDNGVLVKSTVSVYNELGSDIEYYYYKSGDLVCVRKEKYIYNKPRFYTPEYAAKVGDTAFYEDSKTVVKKNAYYFYDGRMVKWINEEKKDVPETDRLYSNTQKILIQDAERLVKMFRQ